LTEGKTSDGWKDSVHCDENEGPAVMWVEVDTNILGWGGGSILYRCSETNEKTTPAIT